MGMDLTGLNPKNSEGKYFRANVWSWRPIHGICQLVIERNNLGIDTNGWAYNDGKGVKTQEDCDKLADGIENFIQSSLKDVGKDLQSFYICMGMWSYVNLNADNVNILHPPDETNALNKQYPVGTILTGVVISPSGALVEPSHSVSLEHLKHFIVFLRNCGGFEIY